MWIFSPFKCSVVNAHQAHLKLWRLSSETYLLFLDTIVQITCHLEGSRKTFTVILDLFLAYNTVFQDIITILNNILVKCAIYGSD
jgi:hypothetical protein